MRNRVSISMTMRRFPAGLSHFDSHEVHGTNPSVVGYDPLHWSIAFLPSTPEKKNRREEFSDLGSVS